MEQQTNLEPALRKHQTAMLSILMEFNRVCHVLDIPYVLFAGTLLGAVRHGGFIPWDDDLDVMMLRKDYERFLSEAPSILDTDKFFLQKEFSDHWPMFFSKLRMNGTTCLEKYHPKDHETHQGIYIDIFPCDDAAKTNIGKRIQFIASKIVIAKSLYKRGYDTDSKKKKIFIAFCRFLPLGPFKKITRMGKADSEQVHSFLGGASGYNKNIYPRHFYTQRSEMSFEGSIYPVPYAYDSLLTMMYGDYTVIPDSAAREKKQHAILVDLENSYENYKEYRDAIKFDIYTRSIR